MMTDNRLKSFLHPVEGIDDFIFIKLLYALMDRYMDDADNTPNRCMEANTALEEYLKALSGKEALAETQEDLLNELETAYMWYGMYCGLEFYSMLQKEMVNISDVARRIHPDNKV